MRTALKSKSGNQGAVAKSKSFPAPISGWNARDALASMPPTDARVLENWYPSTSDVEVRGGYRPWTLAYGINVRTLMIYTSLMGVSKMLAVSSDSVSPITEDTSADADYPGGLGPPNVDPGGEVHPITNAKVYWTMMNDGTTQWLICCNGTDTPFYFNGTAWTDVTAATSPALTGMTPLTSLIYPNIYKGRLFFIEKDTLKFYYLAAGAAGGALSSFNLGAECKKGGYLVAMSSWTRDAGDGQDDVAVFVTSEGEAIIYQGNNPSDATNWSKVGTFFVGRPLGRRCMEQFGGDLLILTESGLFPLSNALQSAQINNQFALSYKIESAFVEAARLYGNQYGWRIINYPKKHALLVNVPHYEGGVHEQFVMNTITKSWCKFTGWYAEDFAVFNGYLFFLTDYAGAGLIMLAWHGPFEYSRYQDNNPFIQIGGGNVGVDPYRPIVTTARQAYQYLGGAQQKHLTGMRPVLQINGHAEFQPGLDVNFHDSDFEQTVEHVSTSAIWDEALWDEAVWAEDNDLVAHWTTPAAGPGFVVAPILRITSNTVTAKWIATDVTYEQGALC
jgi:hypothetical protein